MQSVLDKRLSNCLFPHCNLILTLIYDRYVVDGPTTRAVFNGAKQLVELTYTRANTMVAGIYFL